MPQLKYLSLAAIIAVATFFTLRADGAELHGADHHMHLRSSDNAALWAAICSRIEGACPPEMPMPPSVNTSEEAIAALDAAGLQKGVLLSLAYFCGMPEMASSEFDSAELARKENTFVAEQAAKYPDRLVGLFSVNPLADYALDEVRYQADLGALRGLKLHFTNSAVDLSDPELLPG